MRWLAKVHAIAVEVFLIVAVTGLILVLVGSVWQAIRGVWGF